MFPNFSDFVLLPRPRELKFTEKRPFLLILSVIAIFRTGRSRTKAQFSSPCPYKRQSFCQMQRLINQHTKLSVKFTAKLFLLVSIISMRIVMHTQKNRIRFAIDGKPSGFSI